MISVSVIIPAHNEEKHIKACIESLLSQTNVDVELIVVDNGSTDKTAVIVSQHARKHPEKVRLIKMPLNLGLGGARNVGAQLARHEILMFLDADMVFPQDYVSKMVKKIVEGKTLCTAHGEELINNVDNRWVKVQGQLKKNIPKQGSEIFRAIRRDVFLQYGGFDSSLNYHDDRTFFYRSGLKAEVVEDAVCYHNNPDTASEVFRRNYWIGRTFIAVQRLEKGSRGLLQVSKVVAMRLLDLLALPLALTFISVRLVSMLNLFLEILLLAPSAFFIASTARTKILPGQGFAEKLKLRLFYAPAYRVLRAAGLLAGVAVSLMKGLRWKVGEPVPAQLPSQAHPEP